MKSIIVKSFFAAALLVVGLISAQAHSVNVIEKATLLGGCVGECGSTSSITYRANGPGSVQMALLSSQNVSLCANTGALAQVYVNGAFYASVDLTQQAALPIVTGRGSTITVTVTTFNKNNGISCKRLGNLNFNVSYLYPITLW